MDPATSNAFDDDIVGYVEREDVVDLHDLVKHLRLTECARKPVEQPVG